MTYFWIFLAFSNSIFYPSPYSTSFFPLSPSKSTNRIFGVSVSAAYPLIQQHIMILINHHILSHLISKLNFALLSCSPIVAPPRSISSIHNHQSRKSGLCHQSANQSMPYAIWNRLNNKKHAPFSPMAYLLLAIFKHPPMAKSLPPSEFKAFLSHFGLFMLIWERSKS